MFHIYFKYVSKLLKTFRTVYSEFSHQIKLPMDYHYLMDSVKILIEISGAETDYLASTNTNVPLYF